MNKKKLPNKNEETKDITINQMIGKYVAIHSINSVDLKYDFKNGLS